MGKKTKHWPIVLALDEDKVKIKAGQLVVGSLWVQKNGHQKRRKPCVAPWMIFRFWTSTINMAGLEMVIRGKRGLLQLKWPRVSLTIGSGKSKTAVMAAGLIGRLV